MPISYFIYKSEVLVAEEYSRISVLDLLWLRKICYLAIITICYGFTFALTANNFESRLSE